MLLATSSSLTPAQAAGYNAVLARLVLSPLSRALGPTIWASAALSVGLGRITVSHFRESGTWRGEERCWFLQLLPRLSELTSFAMPNRYRSWRCLSPKIPNSSDRHPSCKG